MEASTPLFETRGLSYTYPARRGNAPAPALRDVDFELHPAEVVAIIGPSGAGKSTLLRCLNGLLTPTSGEVLFQGEVVHSSAARAREVRTRVGMIFQNFGLVPRLSVLTNVLIGRAGQVPLSRGMAYWFTGDERQLAHQALDKVGIPEQWAKRPRELSGGQQQRVAIARALCQQPLVLLADEPVSALDPATARIVLDHAVRICREEGIAVVANLHSVSLAKTYGDRVVAFKAGRKVYDSGPEGLTPEVLTEVYGEHYAEF